MTAAHFSTAEAAQEAFYQAIERADLTQMMAIWSEEEDVICIHPGGSRHSGIAEVRGSWRQIFLQGPQLKFSLVEDKIYPGRMLSVHNIYEQITHISGKHSPASAVATNIFALSGDGWKMLMHHASPFPTERSPDQPPPSVLH